MCANYFFCYLWSEKKREFSTSKGVLMKIDFFSENHIFLFCSNGNNLAFFTSSHSLFLCSSSNLWLSAPETTIKYGRTPTYIHQIAEMFQPERTSPSPRKQSNLLTGLPFKTFPPTFQNGVLWFKVHAEAIGAVFTRLHPPTPPPPPLKDKAGLTITLWYDRVAHMLLPSRYFQR